MKAGIVSDIMSLLQALWIQQLQQGHTCGHDSHMDFLRYSSHNREIIFMGR